MRITLLAASFAAALAGQALADPAPRTLTITASGAVEAVPDRSELTAGVVTQAPTAAAALSQDSAKMRDVFAALERLGVPKTAIRTSNFSVSPNYPVNAGGVRSIASYSVSNTVTVTLDRTDAVGPALDALVAAGANQIQGVSFAIADPAPLLVRARAEAVHEAMSEALDYAKAAGVALGQILSIAPETSPVRRPVMMMRSAAMATPVEPGTQSVSASVTITWEIR